MGLFQKIKPELPFGGRFPFLKNNIKNIIVEAEGSTERWKKLTTVDNLSARRAVINFLVLINFPLEN
jgi:hypothetical protein